MTHYGLNPSTKVLFLDSRVFDEESARSSDSHQFACLISIWPATSPACQAQVFEEDYETSERELKI